MLLMRWGLDGLVSFFWAKRAVVSGEMWVRRGGDLWFPDLGLWLERGDFQ